MPTEQYHVPGAGMITAYKLVKERECVSLLSRILSSREERDNLRGKQRNGIMANHIN